MEAPLRTSALAFRRSSPLKLATKRTILALGISPHASPRGTIAFVPHSAGARERFGDQALASDSAEAAIAFRALRSCGFVGSELASSAALPMCRFTRRGGDRPYLATDAGSNNRA